MPLIRWGISLGLGGSAIAILTGMLHGEKDEEDLSTMGEQAWVLMEFMNAINALGLYGDFAASMEHGSGFGETPIIGTFVGPHLSTMINSGVDLSKLVTEDAEASEILKKIIRTEIPGLRQIDKLLETEILEPE